jgi:hypothetical protein
VLIFAFVKPIERGKINEKAKHYGLGIFGSVYYG